MSSKPSTAFYRRARFRLTLFFTAVQLVLLVILCAFLLYRNNRTIFKVLERFLKDEAADVAAFVHDNPDDWPAIRNYIRRESNRERYYRMSFRLLAPDGAVKAGSRALDDDSVAPVDPAVLQTTLTGQTHAEQILVPDLLTKGNAEPYLQMVFPLKHKETREVIYALQVLAELRRLRSLGRHFLHNIYSAIPILVLISWFSGYAIARRLLRPIHTIARTARRITSTNLNERLPRTHTGDELDTLAATLNDMIRRLEDSFGLLRQFAADAAHELRTPLTIMKGETELALRSRDATPEAYRATLEGNIRECDHMVEVVNNLLLLCRADTGDAVLAHEPVRLDELLADLAETFRILAEDAGLTLDASEFPETLVLGERSRLHELFANLLDNAVKYTPAGGRISLDCRLDPDEAHVTVADTGVGIPEDEQEKIYGRFYRVQHSRSREVPGSGLGLSIARWVAAAHHGRIGVDSAPGAGSSFTVTLPLAAGPHAPAADQSAPSTDPAP